MIEPLISVIIPVYNTATWLRKCLDSIINQTYRNLEIICVNDGSTDDSASILDAYAAKDARIKVIHQTTNAGLSAARNAGLRAATGVYVSGVDSDDYLDLHAYSVLLPHLQDEPDMVCFGIRGVNGAGRNVSSSYMQFPGAGDYTPDVAFLLKSNAYFCNKLFNLKKIREWKVEFPVGLRHEDVAFVYAYMPQCEKVRCVADTLYNYLQRDGSISNSARMQLCAYDFCLVLESLYGYYRRRGLFPLRRGYFLLLWYRRVPRRGSWHPIAFSEEDPDF